MEKIRSAKVIEACVKTLFYMGYKILDYIGTFMGKGYVDGVVEIDETFIAESFKDDKDIIKSKNIIVHSTTNFVIQELILTKMENQFLENPIPCNWNLCYN